jgi:leucyl aminopeptidase
MNSPLSSPLGTEFLKSFFEDAVQSFVVPTVANEVKKAETLLIISTKDNYTNFIANLDVKYKMKFLDILKTSEFEGKEGSNICSYVVCENIKRVSLILLPKECDVRSLQEIGASFSNIISHRFENAILEFDGLKDEEISEVFYGLTLRNYRFIKYFENKKEGKASKLKSIYLFSNSANLQNILNEKAEVAKHNMLARDLINSPPIDLNPTTYSQIVKDACANLKNVEVEILDVAKMEELKMHSLLAVGHASVNPSKTVVMKYTGNPSSNDVDFALVGKGVCFDSGGYSLKPSGGMEDMKSDMGGSAAAFCAFRLIAKMGLKINVVASIGLVENLVDDSAYKPGDVLRSMSGQTIEVLNTDAEGRLVLADLLYYTQKNYQPKSMINLATLTGAVIVALADVYAGLMYNNNEIASDIEKAGEKTGELAWRLPLRKEYDSMINSTIADMKNIGSGRGAGTVTAGQFLKRFVNVEKGWEAKWAHLDIAGVAFDGKGGADPKTQKGGTGWGVNLLYTLIKDSINK